MEGWGRQAGPAGAGAGRARGGAAGRACGDAARRARLVRRWRDADCGPGMRGRVLVVDDDPSLSERLGIVLRGEGRGARLAAGGGAAPGRGVGGGGLGVDDDPSLSEMLGIVLRGEGLEAAFVADGDAAL